MTYQKHFYFILWILFLFSCARQSSPTGGPKDTIPPILVRAIPQNEAIQFKGQKLELLFNEMIVLNNPKEQLIITPALNKGFDIKVKKNSVLIDFDNPLQENTTYTFNFRESIQDITEKNSARNLQLALSTGDYIDSLSISGNVSDLIRLKSAKETTVAIHPRNDTFNVLKHPATYFTKSDEKGNFKIDHLKPGEYYLYAFDDKNRNLFIDSKNESYGFLRDSILLANDTAKISVSMIRLDARPLKITSARPYNSYFNIKTSKNLKNFKLFTIDGSELFFSYGEDQANIRIYNTLVNQDSLSVNLIGTDSIENKIDSIFYIKFQNREVTPEKFTATLQSSSILADKGLITAKITFTKPLKEINFDSLLFRIDSVTQVKFTKENITYEEATKTLTLTKKIDRTLFTIKEEKPTPKGDTTSKEKPLKRLNEFFAAKGTFISVEKDSSKRLTQMITPLKGEELSTIEYTIKTEQKNLIIQLLDKDFKVIKEILDHKKGKFDDLPAGEYQVRTIVDTNNNSSWDAGNILKRQEPEPMFYSKDEKGNPIIKLKASWDFELPTMLITY